MNASIRSQTLHGAYVQENGIIRLADGRFLGRLDGIEFEEVVERSAAPVKAGGMSERSGTEGVVLGYQHMHAFAPEDFRKVYGQVTHAILRGDTRMTALERVRDMVSRVWIPANLALRDDKDVAGIGVRMLLAWSQELALIVAQMKGDQQEREGLRAVLWTIRTEGFDPNCHYCRQVQSLVEKALLGGPPVPPPQLEWVETIEENVPVHRAQHGKYSLEVVNGRHAVSWWINSRRKLVAANGGMTHVETAMEEAERALQGLLEAGQTTPPPASTAPQKPR